MELEVCFIGLRHEAAGREPYPVCSVRTVLGRQGETFRVEYFYYVLLILILLAGCLFALKIPGHNRLAHKPEELAARTKQRRSREQERAGHRASSGAYRHAIIERELKKVRTPWGWPGGTAQGRAPAPDAQGQVEVVMQNGLRRWVDHLVTEKRTVQDETYLRRREDSLRALLEDRYGRAIKPSEMTYRKVKPPLLRDPTLPYDQMDNFPSGKADRIASGLERQPGDPHSERATPLRKTGSLRDIKKPWGW